MTYRKHIAGTLGSVEIRRCERRPVVDDEIITVNPAHTSARARRTKAARAQAKPVLMAGSALAAAESSAGAEIALGAVSREELTDA